MSRPCPHEDAVLAAALTGSAEPLTAALTAHLAQCDACRDLHLVASAVHDDRAAALARVQVPSAGLVWWRAELRARQEAANTAARPITVATGLAVASLLGVLASVAGVIAWWLQDHVLVQSLFEGAAGALAPAAWAAPSGVRVVLWGAASVLLIATPVLLYLALREE